MFHSSPVQKATDDLIMGMESFTISLGRNSTGTGWHAKLMELGFVESKELQILEAGIPMELETEEFIIEALVSDGLCMRLALSNPSSADHCFCILIRSLLDDCPTTVSFGSSTERGLDFSEGETALVVLALEQQIPKLRELWCSRTGAKIGKTRVRNAYKFLLGD
jgi:hypothetical protein